MLGRSRVEAEAGAQGSAAGEEERARSGGRVGVVATRQMKTRIGRDGLEVRLSEGE